MKALTLANARLYLPEILLAAAVGVSFFVEFIATSKVNYVMIFCGLILSILVVWKNKFFALIISLFLGFISFYMMFAVLSEYMEFPPHGRNGLELLVVGEVIFGSLLVISFLLPKKYFAFNKER